MLESWRVAFNNLQQERRNLVQQLNRLPPSQLAIQPSPVAWSILQVVEHLMLVERAMVKDAKERLAGAAQAVTARESLMSFVVVCVLNSGMKVKTPSTAKSVIPGKETTLDIVNDEWSVTRDDLALLLEELSSERQASAVFRHPVSGGLTAMQGLRFIRSHIRHHHAQIKRLAPTALRGSLT